MRARFGGGGWREGLGGRAALARRGGRRGGWTGGRPPRRCTSGFVGASVFVRRTNGERTRRWALQRRKIHISSTALALHRPPAHFPPRRSQAPRFAAASCPLRCPLPPCRRRARRTPQRPASSSLGWRSALQRSGDRSGSVPLPRPAQRTRPSLRAGLDGCVGQGGSRMLGTVKMEGHESSDWNSYYTDTQEVRSGEAAGRPQSRYPGRPGPSGLLPGLGRLTVWPPPGLSASLLPAESRRLQRAESFRKLWALKTLTSGSTCLCPVESGEPEPCPGVAVWPAGSGTT